MLQGGEFLAGDCGDYLTGDDSISRRSQRDVQYPPLAPALVFEVISESDEAADIEAKRRDYLAAGSLCVVEVYPT